MNSTNLKSLDNLPEVALQKLEISDNKIKGEELAKVIKLYSKSLVSFKVCNNRVDSLEQVLNFVKEMPTLLSLDLTDNQVSKLDGYREKVFEAAADLKILDGSTLEGEEAEMSSDEDEYGEEGGEADFFD